MSQRHACEHRLREAEPLREICGEVLGFEVEQLVFLVVNFSRVTPSANAPASAIPGALLPKAMARRP